MLNNVIALIACEEIFKNSSSTVGKIEKLNEQTLLSASPQSHTCLLYIYMESDDEYRQLFIQPQGFLRFL